MERLAGGAAGGPRGQGWAKHLALGVAAPEQQHLSRSSST